MAFGTMADGGQRKATSGELRESSKGMRTARLQDPKRFRSTVLKNRLKGNEWLPEFLALLSTYEQLHLLVD